jgi:isocitrate/isopropylmalate dehydrogenase
MVVFRENTEGLYTQNGFRLGADSDNSFCVDHMIYTQVKVRKFLQAAFLWAKNNNRKRIDLVDKANAIPNNGRLWREEFDKVSKKYPEIKTRKHYIDAYCCRMVTDPEKIDVVVTSNLFGDILGDLGAGITGGLGLAGSANINPETKFALFEPIHGSAPDIAGQGVANPIACFHSLSLMLSHLEYTVAAKALDSTIEKLVTDPAEEGALTPDLGGQGTTNTLTQRALHLLEKELS